MELEVAGYDDKINKPVAKTRCTLEDIFPDS